MKRQVADLVTADPSPGDDGEARPDGDDEVVLPPHPGAVPIGILTAAVLIVLDQATKALVEAVLTPGRFVAWLSEDIGWQLVYNPGGAFGLPLPPWVFLVVTVGVLVLITRVLPATHTLLTAVAYGMLLAGAVGNALDRLLRSGADGFGGGFVVDFVAWGSFPRFNVADSAITVGFVLLLIALLVEERRAEALERGR
ncbi:MAG: signal peptidase II [Nitriliruptoraceae bacterium]